MTTVTIDLKEFDEMRDKIKEYEALKKKCESFPSILTNRMRNVLSEIIEMQSGITDYNKMPKLNTCEVIVDPYEPTIENIRVHIEQPNKDGYYNAKIICNYRNKK